MFRGPHDVASMFRGSHDVHMLRGSHDVVCMFRETHDIACMFRGSLKHWGLFSPSFHSLVQNTTQAALVALEMEIIFPTSYS